MPFGRVNHDARAGVAVGKGVMVVELFMTHGIGHLVEAVALEIVGLARDQQRAGIVQLGQGAANRLGGLAQHSHVETGVVGNQNVTLDEGQHLGEHLGPSWGGLDIFRVDAMNTDVARVKIPPAGRRINQGGIGVDNLAVTHLHQPNSTRARGFAVGCLEVYGGEVKRHTRVLQFYSKSKTGGIEMTEDYWERERRHREILSGQEDIADAAREAGLEAAWAAEAAGREAAEASWEVAEEIRQTREFQIFWDTLTFEEKREWRQHYEQEQRLEAARQLEIAKADAEAHRLAELQRIEENRIAEERRAHLEKVRGIAALDGRYGWISTSAAICLSFVAFFLEGLFLREIWLFIVAAFFSAIGIILFTAKIAHRKWIKDVERNKKTESKFYSAHQLEVDKALENPPVGARFTLLRLALVLAIALYLHFTLGRVAILGIDTQIRFESEKSSISEIVQGLSGASGPGLISYLDRFDFDDAFYKQGADWAIFTEAVKLSNYKIQLESPEQEFEVVPTEDSLKSTSCTQGGWDSASFRNYLVNVPVKVSSDWSTPTVIDLEIFFMADGEGVYAMLDPCDFIYPGALFLDAENTAYTIMSDLGAQGVYSEVSCPKQMAGRNGQKLYCSLSPALEQFTRIEITITDSVQGTYNWRTVE